MDFRYDEPNDAHQQLDHSVVMTEHGYAVYLRYAGRWDWSLTNLATGEAEVVDIRKAGINFAPLELGYVNHPAGLTYLIRDPKRMWKQGLSYDHIKAVSGYIEDDLLQSEALNDTLTNNYPSMQECYNKASKFGEWSAFHRDFAFNCQDPAHIQLEYKGHVVGKLNDKLDFAINEKFHYIKELLEEVINGKG